MSSIRAIGTLAVAAVLSISTFAAQAATIVDTGHSAGPSGNALRNDVIQRQWLAGEFSITDNALISDIQGWLNTSQPGGGTATAAIYTDGGETPGAQLFAASFTAANTGGFDWKGASGLAWALAPGTYWVALEVRTGDTLAATLGNLAPSPLGNEAQWNAPLVGPGAYTANDSLNSAFRIFGTLTPVVSAVPEPSTYALMIAGLGLVGFVAHRRRKTSTPA